VLCALSLTYIARATSDEIKLKIRLTRTVFPTLTCGAAVAAMWAVMSTGRAADPSDSLANVGAHKDVTPQLTLNATIDLTAEGRFSLVKAITFSPDGNYLAVIVSATPATNDIVVWNLQKEQEQSRIARLRDYADADQPLQWNPRDGYITFGDGIGPNDPMLCWDPLTGTIAKSVPIRSAMGRFNRDGSKMLAKTGTYEHPAFRIYDTNRWTYREFDSGFSAETLSWTADEKVLLAGEWDGAANTIDGVKLGISDALARLIDPSGAQSPRSLILARAKSRTITINGIERTVPVSQFAPSFSIVNWATNKIALGFGKILDAKTLKVSSYIRKDNVQKDSYFSNSGKMSWVIHSSDIAFSRDGKYLFVKADGPYRWDATAKNAIVDIETGKVVRSFEGGKQGIALSPDGRKLAVGYGQSVKVFDLK
jgi:WD40 repeat protein